MTREKVKDMSNNELIEESVDLYQSYEALKTKVLKSLDELDEMEKRFNSINRELISRNV